MSEVDWREVPGVRKVGRYLFFGVCACGVWALSAALVRAAGLSGEAASFVGWIAGSMTFFTLRDMSAHWAWALKVQAAALDPAFPLAFMQERGEP